MPAGHAQYDAVKIALCKITDIAILIDDSLVAVASMEKIMQVLS